LVVKSIHFKSIITKGLNCTFRNARVESSLLEELMKEKTDNIKTSEQQNSIHISKQNIIEPEDSLPQVKLLQLPKLLQKAAKALGWTSLMPVQSSTIPYILNGRDLMVQSRTGSGKTGAFLLPILERIDPNKKACQALVLAPTRELAKQVAKEAEILGGAYNIRSIPVYGGVGYGPQTEAFNKGAHIVVGTPGRILDHLLQRTLVLDKLEILVFDEADRMLSMGFYPDMKRIQSFLPKKSINVYMFSATYPKAVLNLADQFLNNPQVLSLSQNIVHVVDTEHVYYVVEPMKKDRGLVRIIEMENPTQAIIFCNTRAQVHYVTVILQRFGYDADELSADLSQKARENVLLRVRNGSLRFLVATDVAARGIDIPDLSHVILYEPPAESEAYIHRAGRTGRAGASGEVISLVFNMERIELNKIAKQYEIDMVERPLPSDGNVAEIVSQRIIAFLEAKLRSKDRLQVERMKRFDQLAKSLSQEDGARAIITMLLDDYYQKTLHSTPTASYENKKEKRINIQGWTEKNSGIRNKRRGTNSKRLRRK